MIRKSGGRFSERSCSNKKMTDEHDSTLLKHALAERSVAKRHRPPNSRCISQPSSPAAASGRAEGLLRAGPAPGRYGLGAGYGANEAEAGGAEGAVICAIVACGPCATLAKKPG